jgi:hypothetical protein
MSTDGLYPAFERSAQRAGWMPRAMVAQPTDAPMADSRRWLPQLDRQPGNPCIGIAVACALSAPFWAALLLVVYLVA